MNGSYDAGPTDVPILEETIGANFERIAAAHPDLDALVDVAGGRRWTYAELDREIDTVAKGLMSLGIEVGDRVGIWAPNCPEWTIVQYATAKIGAILVNINPAYRTHELRYVLNQSGVSTLVSATAFKTSDYVAMVDEVRPEVAALQRVLYIGSRRLGRPARPRRPGRGRPAARPVRRTVQPRPRSTSNTPRGQPVSRRVRRCHTATSSTTASSSPSRSGCGPGTGCASRCRSTTASAW